MLINSNGKEPVCSLRGALAQMLSDLIQHYVAAGFVGAFGGEEKIGLTG